MFATGVGLPANDSQPQLTIIETAPVEQKAPSSSMINTGPAKKANDVDMRSYVLDEYKDVLFPKKLSKYEKAHEEAMQRQKDQEQLEQREVRKKILQLAQNMQYDDDIEESVVSQKKALIQDTKIQSESTDKKAKKNQSAAKEEKKAETLDDIAAEDDEEDEDDFLMDDPMAFIERQDSTQVDVKNLFEDDPKARAKKETRSSKK